MHKDEVKAIESYLKKDFIMLEYGSGGSTSYFPNLVAEYFSIEHDGEWYDTIKSNLPKNVDFNHIDIGLELGKWGRPSKWRRKAKSSWDDLLSPESERFKIFEQYITFPKLLRKTFDAVLIDGRARPECAKFILGHIHDDSIVFIHDFWQGKRSYYQVVFEGYDLVEKVTPKRGRSLVVLKKKQIK
jgi:hypothetical protein